jgi:hypothetical protein
MRSVIWLQTPTVFWLGGHTISPSYLIYMGLMMLGTEIHRGVSERSVFQTELAIGKVKSHKSPGIDQIPAELVKTGGYKLSPSYM